MHFNTKIIIYGEAWCTKLCCCTRWILPDKNLPQGTWKKRTQSHFTSPPLAFKSSTSLLSNVTRFTLEYGEMLSSTM